MFTFVIIHKLEKKLSSLPPIYLISLLLGKPVVFTVHVYKVNRTLFKGNVQSYLYPCFKRDNFGPICLFL